MAKRYNRQQNNEFDELTSAIMGFSENSKRTDSAIEKLNDTIKNLPSFISSIAGQFESSMTFATKEMNKSFGSYNRSFAKAQSEAAAKLESEKLNAAELVDKIKDTIAQMELAAKKSGTVVDETVMNGLKQKLNIAEQHQAELNKIKGEQALKVQTINELKKYTINVMTNAANSIIKIYQDAMSNAFNKFSSSWEANYGVNTSYNSYSKKDYNAVLDGLQAFIKEKGLTNTISINDYQEEIGNILKGGLTGNLATTVAKYSVLSKEGGISADFSDPAFLKTVRQIEKDGGDVERFLSNIMTQSKGVIEEVGDAMGFANGEINTMVDSIYQLSTVTKMTDEAMENTTTSMTALAGVLGSTAFDSNKVFSDITEYAKGGITTDNKENLLALANIGTGKDVQEIISSQGTEEVIRQMMSSIYDQYGAAVKKGGASEAEFLKSLTTALGSSHTPEEIQSLFRNFESYDDFEKEFTKAMKAANKTTEQQYFDKLEDYQTEQEKLNNTAENQLSELGQIATSSVVVEGLVRNILGVITTSSLFGKDGLLNSTNLNKLKSLFTKGKGGGSFIGPQAYNGQSLGNVGGTVAKGGALGKLGSLFTNGTAFASKGGALAKVGKTVFSTGGKALGVAGSLISMGIDAYSGYKEGGAGGALRGAITGSGKKADSAKDVLKGTGSAALKGAGIGMAFGPIGAAVGGVVGAFAGLTTTLIDYNSYESKRIRAFKDLDKYIDSSSEALKIHAENVKKLNDLEDLAKDSASGNIDATKELTKKYPILSKYVDENGKTTEEYDQVLNDLMETEKKKLNAQVVDNYSGDSTLTEQMTNDSVSKMKTQVQTSAYVNEMTKKTADSTPYTGETYGMVERFGKLKTNSDLSVSEILEKGREAFGISKETWNSMSQKQQASFLYSKGFLTYFGAADGKDGDKNYNEHISGDYFSEYLKQDTALDYSELQKYYDAAINSAGLFNSLSIYKTLDEADLWINGDRQELIDKLNAAIINYNAVLKFGTSEDEAIKDAFKTVTGKSSVKDWVYSTYGENTPKSIYDKFEGSRYGMHEPTSVDESTDNIGLGSVEGGGAKQYAVGLDYVPYDNFYARLHKGERIMTAADNSLDKANKSDSSMIPSLQSALISQTDIIIKILTDIYSSISGKHTPAAALNNVISASVPSIVSAQE